MEQNGKLIYTVKKGQPAQINLCDNLLNDVYVCTGIFHSHPNYATNQISAQHIAEKRSGAPFICHNQDVCYRNILVPSSAGPIPVTVALVKLENDGAKVFQGHAKENIKGADLSDPIRLPSLCLVTINSNCSECT